MRVESKLEAVSPDFKVKNITDYLPRSKRETVPAFSILLVDDDPMQINLMETILRKENAGYSIRTVKNAEQAIQCLRTSAMDLVVTDLNMSGLSGIDLLKWIKETIPNTSVIIITGNTDITPCIEALRNGAADYFTKPFPITDLRDAVSKCLEKGARTKSKGGTSRTAGSVPEDVMNMFKLLAHDARDGLVSINDMLNIMNKRSTYNNNAEWIPTFVERIRSKLKKITGVAEDFFNLACSLNEDEKAKQQLVDLEKDIIKNVWSEFDLEIMSKDINVANIFNNAEAKELKVKGNREQLKSVFRNLFSNAIKNCSGRDRLVSCDIQQENERYQIKIFNSNKNPYMIEMDGTGHGRLGEADWQKNGEGVGGGLPLVKKIIQKHGGNIWFEPRNDGNSFVFTLPAHDRAPAEFRSQL